MENKDLKERKDEFKEAANQTIPVMGLGCEKVSVNASSDDDSDNKCKDCSANCYDGGRVYRDSMDEKEKKCKDCQISCYNGGRFYN